MVHGHPGAGAHLRAAVRQSPQSGEAPAHACDFCAPPSGLQMAKIVGMAAPAEFVEEVNKVVKETAAKFAVPMSVDALRAYYLGSRFMVELDIVVPGKTTVTDSHELAQAILDAARAALSPPRPRPAPPDPGSPPFLRRHAGGRHG